MILIIFNYITTIHTHRIPVAQIIILVIWQMIIKRIIRATGFIVSNQTLCKNLLWCHSLSSGLSFLHYMTEQKIWQGKMKKVFVLWLFPFLLSYPILPQQFLLVVCIHDCFLYIFHSVIRQQALI